MLWFMGSQSQTWLSDWPELNWTYFYLLSVSAVVFLLLWYFSYVEPIYVFPLMGQEHTLWCIWPQIFLLVPIIRPSLPGASPWEHCPWQGSWGRRLGITQRQDWASGDPLFPSIYPQNQSVPTLLLYVLTYISDFMRGCPPPPLSEKELTYSSKSIKISGHDKSVSIYKLLWSFSRLSEQVRPATCDCL